MQFFWIGLAFNFRKHRNFCNSCRYLCISKQQFKPDKKNVFESQNTFETQTNSEGPITFQVTPKYDPTSQILKFEITLTAHSGDLNQDLAKNVVLVDDKDNQSSPISWEGDPLGGHHRTGVLKFKSPAKNLKSITLKINPGENIKEVNFTWQMERT